MAANERIKKNEADTAALQKEVELALRESETDCTNYRAQADLYVQQSKRVMETKMSEAAEALKARTEAEKARLHAENDASAWKQRAKEADLAAEKAHEVAETAGRKAEKLAKESAETEQKLFAKTNEAYAAKKQVVLTGKEANRAKKESSELREELASMREEVDELRVAQEDGRREELLAQAMHENMLEERHAERRGLEEAMHVQQVIRLQVLSAVSGSCSVLAHMQYTMIYDMWFALTCFLR
jgi:hypothetical protein